MPASARRSVYLIETYCTRDRVWWTRPPPGDGPALVQGLLQRIEHEAGVRRARHTPADDAAGEDVDDEGDVDEAGPGRDVGEVRDPQPFGRGALNCRLTRSSGQGAAASLMVVRTLLPRTTPCRPIVRISRATVQRATAIPSRQKLPPDLADAVDAEVLLEHAPDLGRQRRHRAGPGPAACPDRRAGRHGRDTSTGRSAERCRSARPRRRRGARR